MRTLKDQEQIHRLWDELHSVPAAESDRALLHLLGTISEWIGAHKAHWAGTVCLAEAAGDPDGLLGWRTCAYRSLHPYTNTELRLLQEIRRQRATGRVDAGDTTRALVRAAGTHRTVRLHDGFINADAFRHTEHYRLHYEAFDVVDRLWSVFPVSRAAEAYFLFDLVGTERRFAPEHADIVGVCLRGLRWFHLRVFLSHGILAAQRPLTRTQRRIIQLLLTGRSEREIADEAHQSPATTHKHIETIYRAFGVNSRAGLMAIWLAGG